ncbi:restriction endonuclease subunit S [Empedobacter brevis]|uniref:Restriction endonuclease subunit S n=1 Tax=Empedobacter brevis TaxID=247 RepID=A0AAJ1V7E2_9FLAO|nr:restriction endonuclease subunit S [Empedobacter brevis]MDM1072037.1 restriction endonuclease subunit S [Empedobacter brevis]
MSKIDEYLKDIKVEYLSVDEIFSVKNGYTPSKKNAEYWENGIIPWFRMEDIRKNGRILDFALQNVSNSALKGNLIPASSLIMSTTATLGEYALITVPFLTNQQITSFSLKDAYIERINIKYLFYSFIDFGKWCKENANQNGGLGIIGLSKLKKYKFPIPCPDNPEKSLEIQQEIVRILDQLTDTTNNLKTELENERQIRKKQFEFYREVLLSFEGQDMKFFKLGELCKIASGKNKGRSDNGKYALYGSTGIIGKTNVKKFDSERILVARVGANAGFAYIVNGEYDVSDNALVIDKCDNILTKYLFYYLFNMNLNQFAKGAGQPLITGTFLKNLIIPIPSLEEQERIVNLLDQFDAAHTAIEEEIIKEIKLRTQQYEYYREKLLTFPKN